MTKRLLPIEKLLHWAYADQRVHLNFEGVKSGRLRPDGDDGDLPRGIGVLAAVGGHSHPDAARLDRYVSAMKTGPVIRKHGIAGTRPDWAENARHRFEPRIWKDVKLRSGVIKRMGYAYETLPAPNRDYPTLAVNECGKRSRKDSDEGWYNYVEIVEIDAPHDVKLVRAFYSDWIAGLEALRDTLITHGDSLANYGVTRELPPERPWESTQSQRILYVENRSLTTG